MEWLNYHHLYYFWIVAREGSIAKAAEQLKLAHPTISKQLHQLESSFEEKLFEQVGRNLVLTEFGQTVFRYAEDIFTIGRELQDAVRGRPVGRPLKFEVGIPDAIPKLIAYLLLKPAISLMRTFTSSAERVSMKNCSLNWHCIGSISSYQTHPLVRPTTCVHLVISSASADCRSSVLRHSLLNIEGTFRHPWRGLLCYFPQ